MGNFITDCYTGKANLPGLMASSTKGSLVIIALQVEVNIDGLMEVIMKER